MKCTLHNCCASCSFDYLNYTLYGRLLIPQLYGTLCRGNILFGYFKILKSGFFVEYFSWLSTVSMSVQLYITLYRVTHKEWDCKLRQPETLWIWRFQGLCMDFLRIWPRKKQIYSCCIRKQTVAIPYSRLWSLILCR